MAQKVLQTSLEHIAERPEKCSLVESPSVKLKQAVDAIARGRCQRVADPVGRVENVVLIRHIGSVLLILPLDLSVVVDQHGLLDVLGAVCSAWNDLW